MSKCSGSLCNVVKCLIVCGVRCPTDIVTYWAVQTVSGLDSQFVQPQKSKCGWHSWNLGHCRLVLFDHYYITKPTDSLTAYHYTMCLNRVNIQIFTKCFSKIPLCSFHQVLNVLALVLGNLWHLKPSHVRKLLAFYQVTEYVDHQFVKLSSS